LKELVEEHNFHHDCGMVGMRRLYYALNKCGLQEYAYKIITAKGYPSYRDWVERDATTLWEYWDWDRCRDSKNHHMYSDFMSWMVKTILGINASSPAFKKVSINPYYFEALDWAKGSCETTNGTISVFWHKDTDKIITEIEIPEGMEATYMGDLLNEGNNIIIRRNLK